MDGDEHVVDLEGGADEEAGQRQEREAEAAGELGGYEGLARREKGLVSERKKKGGRRGRGRHTFV